MSKNVQYRKPKKIDNQYEMCFQISYKDKQIPYRTRDE